MDRSRRVWLTKQKFWRKSLGLLSAMKDAKNRTEGSDRPMRLERCIRKRQRSNQRSINDLPDQLLQEILGRVGSQISSIRCKSVCKLWYTLTSSPVFHIDPAFALIVNFPASGKPRADPHYASESPDFRRWRGFKLKYLPCFDPLALSEQPVCVQASYKDLLLCTESLVTQRKFYIVNPLTMRWISLPETLTSCGQYTMPVGLAVKECPVEPLGYKFKVVRIASCSSGGFWVEMFDPDTNNWNVVKFSHTYQLSWWTPTTYQGLVYKGALHWLVENGPIIAFDPFSARDTDGRFSCRFIMRSDEMRHNGDSNTAIEECLTVSEEHIRLLQLITFPELSEHGNEAHSLTVWKLQDYQGGEWVLEHKVYFKDMVSDVSWLQQYVREFVTRHDKYMQAEVVKSPRAMGVNLDDARLQVLWGRRIEHKPEPLACHSNKSHIVYLHFPYSIVSCNLFTKELKLVSTISKQTRFYNFDTVVPISVSSQPTPIPIYPLQCSKLTRSLVADAHYSSFIT